MKSITMKNTNLTDDVMLLCVKSKTLIFIYFLNLLGYTITANLYLL